MNYREFAKRVIHYAKTTNIQMVDSLRDLHLKPLGLPDPRGFTPHLRTVMLDSKTFAKFRSEKADFSGERKWIIHDLLHILFYDFAFQGLGESAFLDSDRFFEVHLASEAFAVLALDYHILSETPGEGLAVEFDKAQWKHFQKLCPKLPHYLSSQFVDTLMDLYLTGETEIFESSKSSSELDQWVGHEIRYAEKQRLYVAQWRADLENKSFDGKIPIIENSFIGEAVQELMSLILGDPKAWSSHTSKLAKVLEGKTNYFEDLKKYKNFSTKDFRFTDFRALPREEWMSLLEKQNSPSASGLFFMWQLAASLNTWTEDEMRSFAQLQEAANGTPDPKAIKPDLWRSTHECILRNSREIVALPPKVDLKSTFFLP